MPRFSLLQMFPARALRRLARKGASLMEFGMVAGLIALAGVGAVLATGTKVSEIFCVAGEAVSGEDRGCAVEDVAGGPGTGGGGGQGGGGEGGGGQGGGGEPPPPVLTGMQLRFEGDTAAFTVFDSTPGDVVVDWGDGTQASYGGTEGSFAFSKAYAAPGSYVVTIQGQATRFVSQSPTTLHEVLSFGNNGWSSLAGAFVGHDALGRVAALPATVVSLAGTFRDADGALAGVEAWDVANVTSFSETFRNADAFNAAIGGWDTSAATRMDGMFRETALFDADIGGWNVGNVTTLQAMFADALAFDADIGAWNVERVTEGGMTQVFLSTTAQPTPFAGDLSGWCVPSILARPSQFAATGQLAAEPVWGACGMPEMSDDPMVLSFQSVGPSQRTVTIRIAEESPDAPDAAIFWGDGTVSVHLPGTATQTFTKTFPDAGPYVVTVSGTFSTMRVVGGGGQAHLASVDDFGVTGATSFAFAFQNQPALNSLAALPSGVVDVTAMFANSAGTLAGVEAWDVSGVRDFANMFQNADGFNRDISGWDMGAARNTSFMFAETASFNQPIGAWDMSSVENMRAMFQDALAFNQPLGAWDVSSVRSGGLNTGMVDVFRSTTGAPTAFVQNLGTWCVPTITARPAGFATNGRLHAEPTWGYCGTPAPGSAPLLLTFESVSASTRTVSITVFENIPASPDTSVLWSDGSTSAYIPNNSSFTFTRTFPAQGTYTVAVSGTFALFRVNHGGDQAKLVSVDSFGVTGITSLSSAFTGQPLLNSVAPLPSTVTNLSSAFANTGGTLAGVELWDVWRVTNFSNMFQNADGFNRDISGWQTDSATNTSFMFAETALFNQPIGGWAMGNVTNIQGMFRDALAFNQPLGAWDVSAVRNFGLNTGMVEVFRSTTASPTPFQQDISSWCVPTITARPATFATADRFIEPVWGSCGRPTVSENPMVLTFQSPNSTRRTVSITVFENNATTPDTAVFWGDGSVSAYTAGQGSTTFTKTFPVQGTYEVRVSGTFALFTVNFGGDSAHLTSVDSFGVTGVTNLSSSFRNQPALNSLAALPSTVTRLEDTFANTTGTLAGVENWDVSRVTNFRSAFQNADGFNRDISGWNTAAATNMNLMFAETAVFNQPIGGWNVGAVTTMEGMFRDALAFNQPIGAWNVANVRNGGVTTGMVDMFRSTTASPTAFQQDLSNWCVPAVTARPTNFATADRFIEPVWGACGRPVVSENPMVLTFQNAGASGRTVSITVFENNATTPDTAVFWGDGSVSAYIAGQGTTTFTKTFPSVGTYEVRVSGTFARFSVDRGGAPANLIAVNSFGVTGITSLDGAFVNQPNLNSVAALPSTVTRLNQTFSGTGGTLAGVENWDVSRVTTFRSTFQNADGFNRAIGGWQMGAATDTGFMFAETALFNQPIGSWNMGSVRSIEGMFRDALSFNQPIGGWDVSDVSHGGSFTGMLEVFRSTTASPTPFQQDISDWCVPTITSRPANFATADRFIEPVWGSCGRPTMSADPMVLTFQNNGALGRTVTIVLTETTPATPDAAVFWGDGTVSAYTPNQGATVFTKTFPAAGTYEVRVSGTFNSFSVSNSGNPARLLSVDTFGTTGVRSLSSAFAGQASLNSLAPLPTTVTNLDSVFSGANGTLAGVENWDVSRVTSFRSAFRNADGFNRDITGWNTAAATSMELMFAETAIFDRDIGGWNVSNVSNLQEAFRDAAAFAQDLTDWCVTNITTRPASFATADRFPEPVWGSCGLPALSADPMVLTFQSNGTTGRTVSITLYENNALAPDSAVFWGDGNAAIYTRNQGATTFTKTFPSTGTYQVQLSGTFAWVVVNNSGSPARLVSVDDFGTTGVTTLSNAFTNQPALNSVAPLPTTVTNLTSTFQGSNGTLAGVENWDVSRVTNFSSTFRNADGFNRDISGWNTAAATNMTFMFAETAIFNQPIGGWNTGALTQTTSMFQDALAFNQPLGAWDVRDVARANMASMFHSTAASPTAFTQDLSGWCVAHINPRPTTFAATGRLAAEPRWGLACP